MESTETWTDGFAVGVELRTPGHFARCLVRCTPICAGFAIRDGSTLSTINTLVPRPFIRIGASVSTPGTLVCNFDIGAVPPISASTEPATLALIGGATTRITYVDVLR